MTTRLRTVRNVTVVVLLLLGTALVVALVTNESRRGFLNPEGVDEQGARALVQLLEDQGVAVNEVRSTIDAADAAGPGSTVLVTVPDLLTPSQADTLVDTGADLILVAPDTTVTEFSDRIGRIGGDFVESREPECDVPEAQTAGSAHLGDILYAAQEPAITCYPAGDDAASLVVDTTVQDGRLVVLGTAQPLVNRYLDEDGNAALAMGLLGHNPDLIWYRPTLEEIAAAETSITELLPDWVVPVAWQLGIAALLAAAWQARRLGRVVPEQLPVVVRAAETTEGLARLYRRGRSRDHAAATLRQATAGKLRIRLGLPRSADVRTVAAAAAARTARPDHDVMALLDGPTPPDDAALVRLADELDAFTEEVLAR
jgi:hypothetical protein